MTIECLVVRRLCFKEYTMERLLRITALLCFVTILVSPLLAKSKNEKCTGFDWDPVINAIIEVESEGRADAVDQGGKSCGIMQITPIMVKDCNRILELKNLQKRFTLKDRFSISKSKEMFLLYQTYYNPKNSIEFAIRSWNGGSCFTKRGTQKYFEKVMRKLK